MSNVAIIIPARLESTRFPKKLIQPVLVAGVRKIVLQLTYEAAERAFPGDVFVATDSDVIATAVGGFGGRVLRTGRHDNGTKRVAEAAGQLPTNYEFVVNVQGDEPEIDPDLIRRVAAKCSLNQITTASCPILSEDEWRGYETVKVVTDHCGYALYFSRAPIPWGATGDVDDQPLVSGLRRHIGIYAFVRSDLSLLREYNRTSDLERLERLEQLTWLYCGWRVLVVPTDFAHRGIDRPSDYAQLVNRLAPGQVTGDQIAATVDAAFRAE